MAPMHPAPSNCSRASIQIRVRRRGLADNRVLIVDREAGNDFFAYPDYYVFQGGQPLAGYAMIDIWPEHKSVAVDGDHVTRPDAINDRAVFVFLESV
jgi:hypothetical protein